jgi:adenylate cyclase class IV
MPQPPELKRNVELKAQLDDVERARRVARALGAQPGGFERQLDTYFHVSHGRLKLREIEGKPAVLIWYRRPDARDTRRSDYTLVAVSEPDRMKQALAAALGVRTTVEKRRELFFYRNVRIHLDQVTGRGTFLEFEAVLKPDQPEEEGHELLRELRGRFNVRDEDLIEGSYGDVG